MKWLLVTSLFFLPASGGGAMAQGADDLSDVEKQVVTQDGRRLRSDEEVAKYLAALEAKKRERLDNACDGPKASLTHALIELCNWIGQHR